jgi:Secretion system C-terminal sorting domain
MKIYTEFMAVLLLVLLVSVSGTFAANITIIESQSGNGGHTMDINWQSVASGMGHTASIMPQTTLDNTSFIETSDMLIVSSGVIELPDYRVVNIQEMLEAGKPVYIQCEYLMSYTTTQAYASIVTNLDGSFSWSGESSGDLQPMEILGSLATTPNNVGSLSYYWYGVYGTGTTGMIEDLSYGGNIYGWTFDPPNSAHGMMCCTTDQDWARTAAEQPLLMENYITRMLEDVAGGPVQFNLHPQVTAIPPGGGNVVYDASLLSELGISVAGLQYRTYVTLPNGQVFGPLTTISFTLTPFMNVYYTGMTQNIPADAPGGDYIFSGAIFRMGNMELDDDFTFTKAGGVAGASYMIDPGTWSGSSTFEIAGSETEIQPSAFELSNAYPNPFNPSTTVHVVLGDALNLQVSVFDVQGRAVATLADGYHGAGQHTFSFDAHGLASGVYFLQARVGGEVQTRKLILMQ